MRIRESITRRLPLKVPVAPTFSGLRIADTERVPEPLRGRVIPWMQVRWLRGYEANFMDDTDGDVTQDGRRVTGTFESDRQHKVAWRLLERDITRRFEAGTLDLQYPPQTKEQGKITSLPVIAGWAVFVAMSVAAAVGGVIQFTEFLQGTADYEPQIVRIIFAISGTLFAGPSLMCAIFLIWIRIESRRVTVQMHATSTGVSARRGDGTEVKCLWDDLESIEYPYLIFRDQPRLRAVPDARFRALLSIFSDDLRPPLPSLKRFGVTTAITTLVAGSLVTMTLVTLERHGYLESGEMVRMLTFIGLFLPGLLAFVSLMLLLERRSRQPRSRRRGCSR